MLFQANFADWVAVRRQQKADTGSMLLQALENALLPLCCAFCGIRTVYPERYICSGCDADLSRIASPPPPVSSPLEHDIAPLAYEFPVDAAIKALKFRRRLFYGPALAELLCRECELLPDSVDAVLPVPLHWRRRWFRGFNQADEIAVPVARHLGVGLLRDVTRVRATPFQSGLSARERSRNLRGAFDVRGRLSAHHVLIIDDVITTGATVRQLARVLRQAGVGKVSALAVARA
jgi:ComF family protein